MADIGTLMHIVQINISDTATNIMGKVNYAGLFFSPNMFSIGFFESQDYVAKGYSKLTEKKLVQRAT